MRARGAFTWRRGSARLWKGAMQGVGGENAHQSQATSNLVRVGGTSSCLVQRVIRLARAGRGGAGRKHVKCANVRQSGRADA